MAGCDVLQQRLGLQLVAVKALQSYKLLNCCCCLAPGRGLAARADLTNKANMELQMFHELRRNA